MHDELFPATSSSKGDQAKRRLLLAALNQIGEKGYETASTREISDEAGQNVAAIAYYFGSKEKLYAEVLGGIGNYLISLMGPISEETRERLDSGTLDPAGATNLLKRVLNLLLGRQLEGQDFTKIRLVMMREQAAPSASFEILYQNSIRPLQEIFCRLLAVAIGGEPDSPELMLRSHAIFGQVVVFTVARATILRRLGIERFEPHHVAMISRILDEQIDRICGGGPFTTHSS